jgi:antitoxin component of MazEF toxin-antitoxin module
MLDFLTLSKIPLQGIDIWSPKIPKTFADEIGLEQNSSVRLMIKEGALVVTPEREPKWCLEELLEKVTKDNIHREWETGSAEGDEIW